MKKNIFNCFLWGLIVLKGTMHEREHRESSIFLWLIQFFFALNIGKCHLKKNYEEKSYPHLSFFKICFYLNRFDIHMNFM